MDKHHNYHACAFDYRTNCYSETLPCHHFIMVNPSQNNLNQRFPTTCNDACVRSASKAVGDSH